MRLDFQSIYKSIKSLKPTDLPNFTILTGVNGSGKTQLLEGISGNTILVDGEMSNGRFRLFNWSNLIPNDSTSVSPSQLAQERNNHWPVFHEQIHIYRSQITTQLHQFINQRGLVPVLGNDVLKILSMSQDELLNVLGDQNIATEVYSWIQSNKANYENAIDSNFTNRAPQYKPVIDYWKRNTNKSVLHFSEDDFYESYVMTTTPVDVFQQSFSRLFTAYEKMRVDNDFREFRNRSKGEPVSFLSHEEFIARYGEPPWEFLNTVLENANLDFRVTKPVNVYEEKPYQTKLIHQRSKDELNFSDLSSGEKIIMSFALCLYYAADQRQIVQYPKILLFDEIDAPLHPSMTQSLLDTIQATLVEKHGIKVIMTTHSPSTVALAPENSLYAMEKDGYERVKKISKDGALALLTTGVPTLSIDYENRRQVFVESEYDVGYYEKIYNACRHYLEPKISLTFIASGFGKQGNCEQVKHIVGGLVSGGNRSAYGVIDWDTSNQGDERVKVLGKDKRYSIENYLLEPVFIALLLLKDSKINGSALGLDSQENYRSVSAKIDNGLLQSMTNFVAGEFLKKYPTTDSSTLSCNCVGGYSVEVPNWYLKYQGHDLEGKLKAIFPSLNQYHKESALKMAVLDKIIIEFPELLSIDFVELFKEVQNYQKQ